MSRLSRDQELLRALRRAPIATWANSQTRSGYRERTSTGPLRSQLREPVERLLADGLFEEGNGRHRLTETGCQTLADRELGQPTRI